MSEIASELQLLLTVVAGVLDTDGVLLEANAGLLRLLAPDSRSMLGTTITRFFVQPTLAAVAAIAACDADGYAGLISIRTHAGDTRTLRGSVSRTPSGLYLLAEYDIVGLERLSDGLLELNQQASVDYDALARMNLAMTRREGQMLESSLSDALTGIGNRRSLEQSLAVEINRARSGGEPLCAVMLDIDHFKRVNDDFGHAAGDVVLAHVGALLKAQTRSTDVVARFGGEEFTLLLPLADLAQAAAKAAQIGGLLSREPIGPLTRPVTASFGVAELAPGEDGAALLSRADAALYDAKRAGRDRVVAAPSPEDSVRPIGVWG
jgi:two-component system cell cycle response regulator